MCDNPLTPLGELSKPANTLIEKVSDAVGGIFKPYQIKRIAKAEAEASIIKTKSDIEIQDITNRAMARFIQEETNKQKNIEEITKIAISGLNEDAKSEQVENDWIVNFFDKSRLISDEEMQRLWGKVLAGEANKPNTYSKRTVNLLSSLDKRDAQLFTNLCTFGWQIGDIVPVIFKTEDEIYQKKGINFSSLNHLESIGLITFNSISGYRRLNIPKRTIFYYYGVSNEFEFPNDGTNELKIGQVLLTHSGQELAPVCNPKPDDDFYDYAIQNWEKNGVKIKRLVN